MEIYYQILGSYADKKSIPIIEVLHKFNEKGGLGVHHEKDMFNKEGIRAISFSLEDKPFTTGLFEVDDNLKEGLEQNEIIILNIAERGLSTGIYDHYISEDVDSEEEEYHFEPNLTWRGVTIRRKDVEEYLALYNAMLVCNWTPNQTDEDRESNEKEVEAIIREMEALEVAV